MDKGMMYGVVVLCRCAYEDSQCVEKQVGVLMTTSSQYVNGESLAKWMHKAIIWCKGFRHTSYKHCPF